LKEFLWMGSAHDPRKNRTEFGGDLDVFAYNNYMANFRFNRS